MRDKIYRDANGNECTLRKLVEMEPAWAESRILSAEAEVKRLHHKLEWLWKNCHIVYFPKEVMSYPIEHAPHANKDCRKLIEAEMKKEGGDG